MLRRTIILLAGILGVFFVGAGVAVAANGVLVCVGYHSAPDGSYVNSQFKLDNFNDNVTIDINRILIYRSVDSGDLLCEGPEETWGSSSWSIGPNDGRYFRTNELAGWCADQDWDETGWTTLKIYWSTSGRGKPYPLYGTTTKVSHASDGSLIGRSSEKCDSLVR